MWGELVVASEREAETEAGNAVGVGRAIEGSEQPAALVPRYSWTVIRHLDPQYIVAGRDPCLDPALCRSTSVLFGVVEQVVEDLAEGVIIEESPRQRG